MSYTGPMTHTPDGRAIGTTSTGQYKLKVHMDPFNGRFLQRIYNELDEAGWVQDRQYSEQEAAQTLQEIKAFLEEKGYDVSEGNVTGHPYISFEDVSIIAYPYQ